MTRQRQRTCCFLIATGATLVVFNVGSAGAQTGVAAPGAPSTPHRGVAGPARGTSSVDGHLVPVGDLHRYSYDQRRFLVSTNPLGWISGSFGASVSYGVHSNVAARLDLGLFLPVDSKVRGLEAGVAAPIYFRRLYDGVFLEPGVIVRRLTESGASANTYGPQVLLGWHWIWDSGLNLAVAAGIGRNFSSDIKPASTTGMSGTAPMMPAKIELAEEKVFASGYLRFGYAF